MITNKTQILSKIINCCQNKWIINKIKFRLIESHKNSKINHWLQKIRTKIMKCMILKSLNSQNHPLQINLIYLMKLKNLINQIPQIHRINYQKELSSNEVKHKLIIKNISWWTSKKSKNWRLNFERKFRITY